MTTKNFELIWCEGPRRFVDSSYDTAGEARIAQNRLIDLLKREGFAARAETVAVWNKAINQFVE